MIILRMLRVALLLAFIAACSGKVELLKDLSEPEANEVMATLLGAGIAVEKFPGKDGAVSLQVGEAEFSSAIALLNSEGLPREKYARMGDVFRKEGLISSPLEERARYLWALSQELSATVSQIDNVIKARVHVVLPERSNGSDPAMPSSAAVFIKYKAGFNHDDVVPQVKRLVASSIPGLASDKVTIVMLPATTSGDPEVAMGQVTARPASDLNKTLSEKGSRFALNPEHRIWIWTGCAALLLSLSTAAWMVWRKWGRLLKRKETAGLISAADKSTVSET